jgi:AcrR family transcriptional regulator
MDENLSEGLQRDSGHHRKADILAAAARAFAETGFRGASLRYIA